MGMEQSSVRKTYQYKLMPTLEDNVSLSGVKAG
jgi:hypothetical protein